jgi:hypothetical protein
VSIVVSVAILATSIFDKDIPGAEMQTGIVGSSAAMTPNGMTANGMTRQNPANPERF